MSFFTEILQDVQRGLRNEIPDQFAPTNPEGFEYNPTYQGTQYPADQPIEPRTVQSVPDYRGNTIPIDAFENGEPPGGVRSFTNIPGRGDGYELIEEATPAGTQNVYDQIGPVDIPEDATPEEQARIRWETNKQYEEARDVQDIHAGGLQNEVQAGLLGRATGKLSFDEQAALQEQKDLGAVGVERTKGLLSMAGDIRTRMLELGTGEDTAGERTALQAQFNSIMSLIDRSGGSGDVVPPPLATPDQMLGATGAREQKEITSSADFVPTISNERKINNVISFIIPDADLNVTAKRFIDAARRKGITMKSLGFSKASLREYGTFARWLNEYLINRPLRALGQHQIGLVNERLTGN